MSALGILVHVFMRAQKVNVAIGMADMYGLAPGLDGVFFVSPHPIALPAFFQPFYLHAGEVEEAKSEVALARCATVC